MVKAKKSKKPSNEDVEGEMHTSGSESENEERPIIKQDDKKAKSKPEPKKGKKKVEDSDSGEDAAPVPSRGGFALLMDDGDDDSDTGVNIPDDEDDDDEPIQAPVKKQTQQEKGGKKSKKGKKKKDDDDEDLDKVLAELELEYSGQKPQEVDNEEKETDEKSSKKAKKKEKRKEKQAVDMEVDGIEESTVSAEPTEGEATNVTETVKSANQKKKEKKKEKKKKDEAETAQGDDQEEKPEGTEIEEDGDKKKKKKKGKDAKEEKDSKKPRNKAIALIQENLRKLKEEEEKRKVEEEERIKKEEEEEQKRLEALRLEKERKEKKKQKEKERKERLKAEGKLLTAKQKLDKARAQELINSLKAKGLELPEPGEKKVRLGTRIKPGKKQPAVAVDTSREASLGPTVVEAPQKAAEAPQKVAEVPQKEDSPETSEVTEVQVEIVDKAEPVLTEVKDAWDESSGGEENGESNEDVVDKASPTTEFSSPPVPSEKSPAPQRETSGSKSETMEDEESTEEDDDDDEGEDDDDDDESSDESESEEAEHKTEAEKKRERALARIKARKEEAEKKRSLDNLRAAVVCVLGHVDTGKTKILDKLRRTNVQVGEAGGITQQIGATNVPMDNIRDTCKLVKGFTELELKLPGLLIIDTPGHESFSNLRSRGSSLCDIAILVVDIMHGLEPQTIESINLLKAKKTPFIVALNKIDRLYSWQTGGKKDIRDILKAQEENTQTEFQQRTKEVIAQFAVQGLNAALFFENPDIRTYVSLVPTSAITGEGMGNLLALIVESCQTMLAKRLMYSELLQATVLEVKAIPGLGTTIDCILINGKLAEGDTIILAGTDGPVVTQIRSLLMPQPMKELRVKNAYIEYKEIKAAQGVKIAGKDLEKAIAGLNLQVAEKPDEVEIFCEEVARDLKSALSNIKLKDRGVYVQASTLGSLEALLEFLKTSKIPVSGIRIGPVVKKDVMKASIMLEHESQYATILAFDVKIERDAQELADSLGVKIFQADIIYHLFDKFMAYREELKQKKRDEFKNIAVFPCRLRIMQQFVFNARDPIICGVMVEAGVVKEGTPICVPSKDFLNLGIVTTMEVNHKPVDIARKGMEVCIKIENIPGETPKLYGRHFDHQDILTSKISRQSIDACKDYFREDLTKADWQLMVELKKLFQIL